MEKRYSKLQLVRQKTRNKIKGELAGKTWNMTVQSIQDCGYSLEHPSFSGTVFAESKNISSKRDLHKGDHVAVEVSLIKKNVDWKFRVKQGEYLSSSKNGNSQSAQTEKYGHICLDAIEKIKPVKAPSTKVKLFIDESGNFKSKGHHVIASICCTDNGNYKELLDEIAGRFKTKGYDYREFHSKDLGVPKFQLMADFVEMVPKKITVYMNSVFCTRIPSYDYYYPMLVSSVISTITHLNTIHEKYHLELYLEDRSASNDKIFCDIIREECLEKRIVVPIFRILTLPKGENAVISLADLFSNVYFSDLTNITDYFKPAFTSALPGCNPCYFEFVERIFITKKAKEMNSRITKGEKIVVNTVTRVIDRGVRTVIEHDSSPISAKVISGLKHKFMKGAFADRNKKNAAFGAACKTLEIYSFQDRLYEIEKILDLCKECIKGKELEFSISLSDFVAFFVEKELKEDSADIQKLQWMYIRNANSWLSANNHIGAFQAEHPVVRKAEDFTKEFIGYTDCWSELADFYTHISVSYQNIFEFEKAVERIRTYVERFSKLDYNPFGAENITGRYIGSLFGCYAQSLFFYSHASFFYTKGSNFESSYEEAIFYSELSELFFDNEEDIERQYIYRAHGHMIKAMLQVDSSALEMAEKVLSCKFSFESLMKSFFENPDEISNNVPYALSAFLKLKWLSGEEYTFRPLSKRIRKRITEFPFQHPYEQILGYLILMDFDEKEVALGLLKNKNWPRNIIEGIILIFRLQNHWLENSKIEKGLVDDLVALVKGSRMDSWLRYGVLDQLEEMNSESYEGIGPITVLPFNYA